jgi:hypothetical protein
LRDFRDNLGAANPLQTVGSEFPAGPDLQPLLSLRHRYKELSMKRGLILLGLAVTLEAEMSYDFNQMG